MFSSRKVAAIVAVVALVASACSSSAASPTPAPATPTPAPQATPTPVAATPTPAAKCTVGVSWNNYQEERWAKWDEPAIKKALAAAGAHLHLERREVVG